MDGRANESSYTIGDKYIGKNLASLSHIFKFLFSITIKEDIEDMKRYL